MALDYLSVIRRETALFAAALRGVDPATRVPTCPDWSAGDLVEHMNDVQWFWGTVVRQRLQNVDSIENDRPERTAEPFAALERECEALVDTLGTTDPDVTVWTWSTDHTVGFVRRRMAHEALVHRLDAELTSGTLTPVDAEIAADGVAEAFEHFFGGWPAWATFTMDGPAGALHATDLGRSWVVRLGRFSGTSPAGNAHDDEICAQLDEDAGAGVHGDR